MVVACVYQDKEFGDCDVVVDTRARRIRARAIDGRLRMTVPPRVPALKISLQRLIDENRPALRRILQKSREKVSNRAFYDGKTIPFYDNSIHIVASDAVGAGRVRIVNCDTGDYRLEYYRGDAIDSPRFMQAVSKYILRFAVLKAREILPSFVAEVASQVGAHPSEVRVGRGRRLLGHCSRSGVVTLSAYVMFLPSHLRRYVVCHELAHLSYFDHSRAFHALCNTYCCGKEKEWNRELRCVEFPICI